MATTLNAKLVISLIAQLDNPIDVGSVSYPFNVSIAQQFTDGVGQDQAQRIWTDLRTIAPSGTDDIDLSGVLLDPTTGLAITLTKVKAIIVKAAAANVNDVQVGAAAANQFLGPFGSATDKIKVKPGGTLVLIAPDANGYAVVAATGDLLRFTNGAAGTSVDYTLYLIGS